MTMSLNSNAMYFGRITGFTNGAVPGEERAAGSFEYKYTAQQVDAPANTITDLPVSICVWATPPAGQTLLVRVPAIGTPILIMIFGPVRYGWVCQPLSGGDCGQ